MWAINSDNLGDNPTKLMKVETHVADGLRITNLEGLMRNRVSEI